QGHAQMLRTRSWSAANRGRPVSKLRTTPAMSENTRFGNSFSRSSSHKCSYLLGIHNRADPPVQFSFQRADRSVNILKLPFVAIGHHWTLWGGSPAAPNPHHAPKAGLVLKHQPNMPPLDHVRCQHGCQHFWEFFFHSS